MSHRFNFPSSPAPITPMVYVKDKTVWQYKLLTRNLGKQEAPSEEEELNTLGKDGWELVIASQAVGSAVTLFVLKRSVPDTRGP